MKGAAVCWGQPWAGLGVSAQLLVPHILEGERRTLLYFPEVHPTTSVALLCWLHLQACKDHNTEYIGLSVIWRVRSFMMSVTTDWPFPEEVCVWEQGTSMCGGQTQGLSLAQGAFIMPWLWSQIKQRSQSNCHLLAAMYSQGIYVCQALVPSLVKWGQPQHLPWELLWGLNKTSPKAGTL